MKLEYIGMENTVERLVRRVKIPKSKDKGKGKAVDTGKAVQQPDLPAGALWANDTIEVLDDLEPFPTLNSMLKTPAEEESSDDESGDEDGLSPGLKLETLEGVRFYDVYGVRIFRKDVMAGRL
jgi:hypothetical protein